MSFIGSPTAYPLAVPAGTDTIPFIDVATGVLKQSLVSDLATSAGFAGINTISGTSHNMVVADAGTYMRFTNASAKTLTVQENSTEPLAAASEYHGRNVGAADLTIVEAGVVMVNPPAGGSLIIPSGGTFTLKRVAVDEFDLFGQVS